MYSKKTSTSYYANIYISLSSSFTYWVIAYGEYYQTLYFNISFVCLKKRPNILNRVDIGLILFARLYTSFFIIVLFDKIFFQPYAWRWRHIVDIETDEWYAVDKFSLIRLSVISFLLRIYLRIAFFSFQLRTHGWYWNR